MMQFVMAGQSRSKNGVASLAYVPGIHVFLAKHQDADGRNKSGHDERLTYRHNVKC
ncbi:hypothetical protein ACWX0K_06870 [Nitrobacteraceae bacterium UC4446_H13]